MNLAKKKKKLFHEGYYRFGWLSIWLLIPAFPNLWDPLRLGPSYLKSVALRLYKILEIICFRKSQFSINALLKV